MAVLLDLSGGIAGDMFLAAALDLGLDREHLVTTLRGLDLPDWSLEVTPGRRGGVAGLQARFVLPPEHHHRHLADILRLIAASSLAPAVRERANHMFRLLAEAEGAVHGIAPEQVHFHEVGALDAILDLCAAAHIIETFLHGPVFATPLQAGSGVTTCHHGTLPVPVPAVAELVRRHGIPLDPRPLDGERATPTGVTILAHLAPACGAGGVRMIHRIGHGLGQRDSPERPNLLRILMEETRGETAIARETVGELSAHIDDMNPEWFGRLWEVLFAAGALDVGLLPLTMKKGRPGVRLEVVCPLERLEALGRLVLQHTTSLGVRMRPVERLTLARSVRQIVTPWGPLEGVEAGGVFRPEYEDLARLAREQGWSLPEAQIRILPYCSASALNQ
ncbi:MAG: nickel pincer cofactor biosynthesis protein LarC [Magnetococcales bacterium]|nr:nickel pincer cofactor biosynthesis protein LarC [Magnetococcales bacterium]